MTWLIALLLLLADDLKPTVAGRPFQEGGVTEVFLAPRFATAIRMPESVNSVVIGDPSAFSAEHSEKEPNLVFVKPLITEPARTNLLISTASGNQVSLLLVSLGAGKGTPTPQVDFLMSYKAPGRFLVDPVVRLPQAVVPTVEGAKKSSDTLDTLLERQQRAPLPILYGVRPGLKPAGAEPVKSGVSEVIDRGTQVVVLFSVVNQEDQAVELMPPQVQLGGKRVGGLLRRERWVTSEQLPVADWRLNRRRIGPGERADGVVVFDRPSYKQARETLLLQVAESGAVDRPSLAPIGFGIDRIRTEKETKR
jgi:hypothetical protein